MKMDCEVIWDLMPLYIEDIANPKSRQLVESHCMECAACKEKMQSMSLKEYAIKDQGEGLKAFKKSYKKHIKAMIGIAIYVTLVMVILMEGKLFLNPDEAMGYAILNFYLLLPTASLLCSCLFGTQKWKSKIIFPLVAGIVGVLIPYLISQSTDMLFFFMNFIPGAIGVSLGILSTKRKKRKV